MKIYQGTAEEKEALARICQEWTLKEFWPYEEFLVSLKIPGTFLLFQSENNQWLSLALGRTLGGETELFYIYVSPRARRRGLADELLTAFCEHALRDWSCERVMLEVRPSNLAAQRLYEKHGFEKMSVRKGYYQNGEDALIYEKTLKAFDA
ncbi:GNAT family N-acetyltransferase [Oligoflexus tunisiensis]|uniref:GNAT family N-acetyltransferase n=1 Tax=Oligoflexus tunisiensis TaxID=708132 RepID=UPI00159F308F|nr:N-acetyltransferase [Oligoflexus tunisiensis]